MGEKKEECIKFIASLKSNPNRFPDFDVSVAVLQEEAATGGLDDDVLKKLTDLILHTDLNATKYTVLIKCLIPRYKLPKEIATSMIIWCLSTDLPVTVSTLIVQWIIGLWDYELVDRKVISIYYDSFFYMMLKKEKLERHLARLIYILTRPEDVTRRDVLRLLALQKKYSKRNAHITALLFLFKSYKPELVPEKINSVNIESVWKPIPENMRVALEDARDRAQIQQSQSSQAYFKWNVVQRVKKKKLTLMPSVGYFHIGSSIFKSENAKLIFDINSIEDLGKYHQNVELPCNAVSLLTNMAGYHLLTYADIQYQSRFSYNLYNTLIRAFLLESEKFSEEQLDQFLTMTVEFSRYMQEGVRVTKLFFDEFLYYNTGEHVQKMLHLLQWMTFITITELRENILVHVRNIFFESTLAMKCEIIKSLQKLITNLFVRHGLQEQSTNVSCFLHQRPLENLSEIVSVLTSISEDLIVHGLNIHKYDVLLLSESLAFYEEICTLESRSHILSWTLAPPAIIYGAFVTQSCAILSRACKLLLRYREMSSHLRQILPVNVYKEKVNIVSIYAIDIYKALWQCEPFSGRKDGYFLRNISKKVIFDLDDCDLDSLLSICNHYAVLPYKYKINTTGLDISTKEAAMSMALYYYPAVNKFITFMQ